MEKRFKIFLFLILAVPLAGGASVSNAQTGAVGTELWCVAKNNAEDAGLQAALNWACGPGSADCSPIQQGGPCYDASDIVVTASYAFNDYYLKHGLSTDSCSFDNTAALTSLNPSQSQKHSSSSFSFPNWDLESLEGHDKCKFPSSLSVSNGSFSGSTTAVGMGPSEDINSCTRIAQHWFWPLIAGHMFVVLSRIISER